MKVLDPGHRYQLASLDKKWWHFWKRPITLRFVKREGPGYPGNVGHYPGTNLQEVLRALIDRVYYLDGQISCEENDLILWHLRCSLQGLEDRAARRHGRDLDNFTGWIEFEPTCSLCGHIGCKGGCK